MSRAHALAALALSWIMQTGCAVENAPDKQTDEPAADEAVVGTTESALLTDEDRACPSVIPKRNAPCSDPYLGCAYMGPKGRSISMYCDSTKWRYDNGR